MRFSIYLRRFGKLHRLYKFHRSTKGLYSFSRSADSYDSWHNDGNSWSRFRGAKTIKKKRQPLARFEGSETLYNSITMLLAPMPDDIEETAHQPRADDIVLDIPGIVATEVILSAAPLTLFPIPSRPDSMVHVKVDMFPIFTLEAWQMPDRQFPVSRFKSSINWVEGQNLFFNHVGRI